MAVKSLTGDNFNEVVLKSAVPVIVDFYADWCQPCKRIAPFLEEISNEQSGKVLVCKVNVDENQALASQFSVMNLPSILSFKDGALYKRIVGAVPKDRLVELIN